MGNYTHTVQYYETDKMGVNHHSNYVRWMGEARVDFLSKIGWPYDQLELEGIISPVTAVECHYKRTSTFSDRISIRVTVEEFKGVRLKIRYLMTNEADETVCEALSEHCFVNEKGYPVRLKNQFPEFYQTLRDLADNNEGNI